MAMFYNTIFSFFKSMLRRNILRWVGDNIFFGLISKLQRNSKLLTIQVRSDAET